MTRNIMIADYSENFREVSLAGEGKIVICGEKTIFRKLLPYLPKVDFLWDLGRTLEREFKGIPVLEAAELLEIKEDLHLLLCFQNKQVLQELYGLLDKMGVHMKVYDLYNNCAFHLLQDKYRYVYKEDEEAKPLKVRIVNYDGGGWILTKFAQRLKEHLSVLGVEAEIGEIDPNADINHHIPFHPYMAFEGLNETLMITHVDTLQKVELIRSQLETARMGICMSKDTLNYLARMGIPREKLCYINPAHDGNMQPKKYVIGITHRCYDSYDLRKRATALLDMLEGVNPLYFKFKIMGSGWEKIVVEMQNRGFEVDYFNDFDYAQYHELVPSLDFYLYFGFDEGSMGYLDALSAGVKTIVTPQGYHLDVDNGIDYSCCTIDQFTSVLYDLQYEREKRIASVADWTWENYAKKHIEIWEYLLRKKPLSKLYQNQLRYEDGIFSCLIENNTI